MTSAEEYLSKANDEYKKGEEYKELANKHFNNYAELPLYGTGASPRNQKFIA